MTCRNCNHTLKGEEKYCPNCGCRTENNEAITIDNGHHSTENFRLASVILGILSLGFFIFAPVSLILSVIGLVFAIKSHKNSNNTVGIVLNAVSLFLASIITMIFMLFINLTIDVIKDVSHEYNNYIEEYNHGDF